MLNRRHNSFYESSRLRVFGLDGEANYRVTHLDTSVPEQHSGCELRHGGPAITMSAMPDAAVLIYSRQP